MKQLSIALNVLLLVLVSILFYLHFNDKKNAPAVQRQAKVNVDPSAPSTKIAYFEMDSLQENYNYFKDALNQIKTRERSMNAELQEMGRKYQKKLEEWQRKGPTMSQLEADAAQRENTQLNQSFELRKRTLEENLAKQSMDFKKDIKSKIENYLKEYNKGKNYTYILSYEPDFIFYKDTTYNITGDLIDGLNASYKKKD